MSKLSDNIIELEKENIILKNQLQDLEKKTNDLEYELSISNSQLDTLISRFSLLQKYIDRYSFNLGSKQVFTCYKCVDHVKGILSGKLKRGDVFND